MSEKRKIAAILVADVTGGCRALYRLSCSYNRSTLSCASEIRAMQSPLFKCVLNSTVLFFNPLSSSMTSSGLNEVPFSSRATERLVASLLVL
jgi:hypothetical protein